MTAPAATAAPSTSGGTTCAETEQHLRAAHALLDHLGYEMGANKVARLVRRFETRVAANGWALFDFMANALLLDADQRRRALADPTVARAISYADPTGETAVGNVMRDAR